MDERIGRLAYSKAGRDKGKLFVIVNMVNKDLVMLADGDLRKIENPKVKNLKHITITNIVAQDVKEYLAQGKLPENHIIRKSLKKLQEEESEGKEVW